MNLAETLEIPAELMPTVPVLADGTTEWTYDELQHAAGHARTWLEAHGATAGSVVATLQGFSPRFVALLYGALALGATLAPLNARAKAPELAALLDGLTPDLVIADPRYAPVAAAAGAAALDANDLGFDGPAERRDAVEPEDGATAILLHTSGTTGRPKPVRLSHDGLTGMLLRTALPADGTPRGTTVLAVPNHHIAGLSALLAGVFSGRRAVLLERFSAEAWLEAVRTSGADHAFVVPTMLRRILDDPGFDAAALAGLRTVAYGAAPMPRPTILEALRRFPDGTRFVGSYGQTETGGTICVLAPEDHAAARAGEPDALERLGSLGRPLDGVEVTTLDGEIATRFDGGDWHRTGDRGRIDAGGYVFLTGRRDDLIIRAGENIDPAEVEQALAEHPAVAEVAVVGLPDAEWGQVVAAFVVANGTPPGEAELIAHAKARIASFKAPSRVRYVAALPRTDLGKLKRRELLAELTTKEVA
ncbi:MAG TPA: AMP-binding protein [Solirubrobacter sp.]|nr:AMP-binding protein [Solirubrobacter sp.]